jgi:hypothetical protein
MSKFQITAGNDTFTLEVGTPLTTQGANLSLYAGGDDYHEGTSVYEADKGFIILEAIPSIESAWGEQGYTTALTARDANVEKVEKITEQLEILSKQAHDDGENKNSDMVNFVAKQILDYYYKFTSTNAHFEVTGHVKSHVVRIPLPWPANPGVDTKTANLVLHFNFHLIKLISPEEMALLQEFLEKTIKEKKTMTIKFIDSSTVSDFLEKSGAKSIMATP